MWPCACVPHFCLKILGGDSAVNGLVWSYPYKTDWDDFENLGNPGWNWNNMYAAARKVSPETPIRVVLGSRH
jgi:hypothetical protein